MLKNQVRRQKIKFATKTERDEGAQKNLGVT